ncbi:NADH-quinone oxidoreductase subunit NuoG [Thiomicrorhabdus sp. ZW0627]|uniref:NADH-quinone oxidoreductase subunit NuoG n=1 Tax=Thiomicrorhabdus sp. ZW0627 TaxID=3039774 RepID=UPI002436CB79|nr:NADH-quinone oxidoreductase subunit NuoG [Thiomicrorhabdus sp. ZW0627]MDG6774677.1 NADH-quinone oxidoreductase subunit NuoG [Thiomicrorhabdus sp. ZW0627]
MVKVEINGQVVEAREGDMLIDVADKAQISIPRFCYHKKLSIAANCRMCLVEVEGAWKPLPACATPVTDGMKVHTKSAKAIAAQKSVMEFLLINHPLDCPICDQGGECELQDVAMDYGDDVSRYTEAKRIVGDREAGSLIQTDMTRCIHCTRCVRFGQEVAGMMELGATGRSEWMEIGTYIEKSITSEMSGNMIDLCPVGALTSKPFRYSARAWELKAHNGIAPHDSMGSNIILHSKDGEIKRVVPRENEAINEVWLSDRDRFAYEGINAEDRLTQPQIKKNGKWLSVDWETALEFAVEGLKERLSDASKVGVLASPSSTVEELHLLQKLARGLAIENIDHRLSQTDFSLDANGFHTPSLVPSIEEVEELQTVLLVGSYLRKELPILNHRIRKAVLAGAKAHVINPLTLDFNYPLASEIIADQNNLVEQLAGVAKAALEMANESEQAWLDSVEVTNTHREIVESLKAAEKAAVMLGQISQNHSNYAQLQKLAAIIAEATGASLNILPIAANEVGAHLVNVLPQNGMNVSQMLNANLDCFINFGVEPELDCIESDQALKAMKQAGFVVNMTAFDSEAMREYADVLLPLATFAETAGTYVNANGLKQSFKMAVEPKGDSKAGWKVLRVLGNLFDLEGFEQTHSNQVLTEVMDNQATNIDFGKVEMTLDNASETFSVLSPYVIDSIVRRSPSLQATPDANAQLTKRG